VGERKKERSPLLDDSIILALRVSARKEDDDARHKGTRAGLAHGGYLPLT